MSNLDAVADVQPAALPITLIHGPPGARKTHFVTEAPSPLLLQTEFGLGNRKCSHLRVEGVQWLYDTLKELGTTEHKYKTLAIDSLDHLAPLVEKFICDRDNKKDLKTYGFGEGYKAEENEWRTLFAQLEKLRTRKGMAIILIAHSARVDVQDPSTETYSTMEPKLPKKVNAVVKELANIIGYAHMRMAVKETEDEKRHIAISQGDFVLELQPKPAFIAKNQYGLPPQIAMTWAAFAEAWKAANP